MLNESVQRGFKELRSEVESTRNEMLAAIKFSYAELDKRITVKLYKGLTRITDLPVKGFIISDSMGYAQFYDISNDDSYILNLSDITNLEVINEEEIELDIEGRAFRDAKIF